MFRLVIMDKVAIADSVGGGGLIDMPSCDQCGDDLDLHDRLVTEVEQDAAGREIVNYRIVGCDRKPRTWSMWARRQGKVTEGPEFLDFGDERLVRHCYEDGEPTRVELTEDPDGTYWGWIGCDWQRGHEGEPSMIQPHLGMFRMQFPYDPEPEQENGKGEIVRMSVRAVA